MRKNESVVRLAPNVAAGGTLSVQNQSTRALQIIGDLVPDTIRVLPGSALDIALADFESAIQLTFFYGGVQIDKACPDSMEMSEGIIRAAAPNRLNG